MDFLDRVKEKPQSHKAQYAFLSALVFTMVIALGWSTTLPARFATLDQLESEQPNETEPTDASFGGLFNAVKSQFANVIEPTIDTQPVVEPTPGTDAAITIPTVSESAPQDFFREDTNANLEVPVQIITATSTDAPTSTPSEPDSVEVSPVAPPVPVAEPRVILIATTSAQQTE